MTVKVISYTKPTELVTAQSPKEFIAYIARISNPSNQHNNMTADRLIRYLLKHKHFSPFEHFYITLEVNTTRDIATQLIRHRSLTFQEFSQRYQDISAIADTHEIFQASECRMQDTKNRQNSLETNEDELINFWTDTQDKVASLSLQAYKEALDKGIAKEVARKLLPIGLTKTRLYVTGNVRSFIHYLLVRLDPTTQKEHRQLAVEIYDAVNGVFDLSDIEELNNVYQAQA